MTLPTILFALMIAVFYGSLYHLIRGGTFLRLLFYILLSALGFTIGHLIGVWRGWILIPLGSLNIGVSSLGSIVLLLLGDWLSRIETRTESTV